MKIIFDHISTRMEEARVCNSDSSHRRMNVRLDEARVILNKIKASLPSEAIQNLTNHQRQLDQDGVMVGVSRQALEEVLQWMKG